MNCAMKSDHKTLALLIIGLLAFGCDKAETGGPDPGVLPDSMPEFTAATGDDATRTALDGLSVVWLEGDAVAVFAGNDGAVEYSVKKGCGGGTTTTLVSDASTPPKGKPIAANVAYYPCADAISCTQDCDSYKLRATIPDRQRYSQNSFGGGAMPMVAVTESASDTKLSFRNVFGVLKIPMRMDNVRVKSIEVKGNAGEKLSGDVTVTCSAKGSPSIQFSSDAKETMTLDCGEGIELNSTEDVPFYIPLPPCTFTKGITVKFITSTSEEIIRAIESELTINRSFILPMPEVNDSHGFNNRTIYITEPGTLSSLISLEDIRRVRNLKLVGEMNEDDIAMMTHSFRSMDKTLYKTETLDLSEASFPDNILYGFNGLAYLRSVKLPPSIVKIRGNKGAFDGCTSLTEVDFGENPKLEVLGSGIWQNINSLDNVLVYCGAFSNCTSLKEITIPESVTTIEGGAFYGSGIEKITFAENCRIESFDGFKVYVANSLGGIQSFLIGMFYGCGHLKTIEIPSSVMMITESAFAGWNGLETLTIPETVKYIWGDKLFSGCTSLKSVSLPKSITEISESMFSGCESLTSFNFAGGYNSIKANAFSGCSSLSTIDLEGVTDIGDKAFTGCGFTSLRIPDSMTAIPDCLFSNCVKLKELDLNKTEIIGGMAFSGSASLIDLTIPESVKRIDDGAFSGCNNLESVHVHCDSVVIGGGAFNVDYYSNPPKFTFYVSNKVRSLITDQSDQIFMHRDISMDNFVFEEGSRCEEFGLLTGTDVTGVKLPEHITKLGPYAFAECYELKDVIGILKNIKVIGEYAFQRTKISKAIIPEGVEEIGRWAFSGCDNLRIFSLPSTITKLGDAVFAGDNNLVTSMINGTDIEFVHNNGDYYGIFYGCPHIDKIYISKNVKSLSQKWESPFNGSYSQNFRSLMLSSNIKEVVFEEGSQCLTISGAVFGTENSRCLLTSLSLPESLVNIGSGAFYGQTQLSFTLSDKWRTIGCRAFYGCKSVGDDENLIFPKELQFLGKNAIPYKTYKTVTINSKFSMLEDCHVRFVNNRNKKLLDSYSADEWIINVAIDENYLDWAVSVGADKNNITVAEGIEHIADNAFNYDKLRIVKLPSTMKTIGETAVGRFVESVYCKAKTPPSVGKLSNRTSGFTIYVPRENLAAYTSAQGWSSYASLIQPYDF